MSFAWLYINRNIILHFKYKLFRTGWFMKSMKGLLKWKWISFILKFLCSDIKRLDLKHIFISLHVRWMKLLLKFDLSRETKIDMYFFKPTAFLFGEKKLDRVHYAQRPITIPPFTPYRHRPVWQKSVIAPLSSSICIIGTTQKLIWFYFKCTLYSVCYKGLSLIWAIKKRRNVLSSIFSSPVKMPINSCVILSF